LLVVESKVLKELPVVSLLKALLSIFPCELNGFFSCFRLAADKEVNADQDGSSALARVTMH